MAWFTQILEIVDVNATPPEWRSLPDPHEMTVGVMDVDAESTGRNQNGKMIRDWVAQKVKLSCKWSMLTQAEMQQLLALCNRPKFTMLYLDPRTGTKQQIKAYVGDRNMGTYYYNTIPASENGAFDGIYRDVEMNFIEF